CRRSWLYVSKLHLACQVADSPLPAQRLLKWKLGFCTSFWETDEGGLVFAQRERPCTYPKSFSTGLSPSNLRTPRAFALHPHPPPEGLLEQPKTAERLR
ncbi:hypothetical protein PMAYCL1PPCAC_15316, partial [Pristionchus mayeri]